MASRKKKYRFDLNDKWILIIGIPIVAIIGPLAFGHNYFNISPTGAYALIGSFFSTIGIWLGIRFMVFFLWNRYPWDEQPLKHLIIEIVAIILYVGIIGVVIIVTVTHFAPTVSLVERIISNFIYSLLITFLITAIHEAWFFLKQWQSWKLRSERLEEENIHSQYEVLKSQVNPHFLFNNLNTLANLIEENPKVAVDYVERTADYYRRILNLQNQEVITIEEELKLVDNYVFLQKRRFEGNLIFNVDISDDLKSTFVPPLTLQMLVENAIKHNVISKENPLSVSITAKQNNNITVSNNLQKRIQSESSHRMGLQNIAKRYRLISMQEIKVNQTDTTFAVSLPVLRFE